MKKIITAMGSQNLNDELKKEENFEIITRDIQYQDGVIEILEQKKDIDFLIISELISGEMEIKNLIEKIKAINDNLQIIIFLDNKNKELENYLYAKGIKYIFYNNQIKITEIIELIKNEQTDTNKQLKEEIERLKLLLEKENDKKYKDEVKTQNVNKIICVNGTNGVGKSIFSINLAKSFMQNKEKTLIIDFDVLNSSLHTILGIKKYPERIKNKIKNNDLLKEMKIEELIIRVNKKIDLISGINLLFDKQYQISSIKIKNIISKLKEKYKTIIIDTSSECFFDYTKEIMKNSDITIFITEANILEIKKAKRLLNIYINQWEIPKNKFNIIFNKYNDNSIDISILKNIFSDFSILGKLSNNKNYNLLINKNDTQNLQENLKEEYLQINEKLNFIKSDDIQNSFFCKMLKYSKGG